MQAKVAYYCQRAKLYGLWLAYFGWSDDMKIAHFNMKIYMYANACNTYVRTFLGKLLLRTKFGDVSGSTAVVLRITGDKLLARFTWTFS